MIFKFDFSRPLRLWAQGLVGLVAVASASQPCRAEEPPSTPRAVLASFFASSTAVKYERFTLSSELKQRLSARLGYAPKRSDYVFYVATSGTRIDGYALIDDEVGQTEPITFAVKLTPTGRVERTEIMIYREPRGEEVRSPRFLAQLRGKTVHDPIRAGTDVDVISGATISSHSMARAIRRALILFDELIVRPRQTAHLD